MNKSNNIKVINKVHGGGYLTADNSALVLAWIKLLDTS